MNARELTSPEHLNPDERVLEIATILALAILRTHVEGDSASASGLGFSARKRLHTTPSHQGDA